MGGGLLRIVCPRILLSSSEVGVEVGVRRLSGRT